MTGDGWLASAREWCAPTTIARAVLPRGRLSAVALAKAEASDHPRRRRALPASRASRPSRAHAVRAAYFRFGLKTCVAVPKNCSADSITVSVSVGCG